jgi:uncharacterized membrane protein YfcA
MDDIVRTYVPLIGTALAAGVINALAGGGTLLTFPALTALIAPTLANGTSTVALLPGSLASAWGYRRESKAVRHWAWLLAGPSFLGSLAGTLLVTRLPAKYFENSVPWLILAATVLFALQPILARVSKQKHRPWPLGLVLVVQFLTAVYGGYFGAGMGIIILATLSFMGIGDIHQMNGVKTIIAVVVNVLAAAIFVVEGFVVWKFAVPMAIAAIIGGYYGAHYGRLLNRSLVRGIVIGIGACLSIYYFSR